jgi:hypothetical protein
MQQGGSVFSLDQYYGLQQGYMKKLTSLMIWATLSGILLSLMILMLDMTSGYAPTAVVLVQ